MHNKEPDDRASICAITAIGLIHTPFKHAKGTPIQPIADENAHGTVELFPEFTAGLRDLAGFERIWLIYLMDRASEVQMAVCPYMDTVERGIFATRSPARPNHIGISAVRLLNVQENRLQIADVDMLDGSPLLDIKPYVPAFDSFEQARAGWLAGKSPAKVMADERFERRP